MNELWSKPAFRAAAVLAAVAGGLWLAWAARAVIIPFAAAFIIAYLLDPVIDRMERRGLNRSAAIVILLLAMFSAAAALVILVAPIVWGQVMALADNVPGYVKVIQEKAAPIMESIPRMDRQKVETAIREGMGALGDAPVKILKSVSGWVWSGLSSVAGLIMAIVNLVIIPVASFYLLRDFDRIIAAAARRIPLDKREWAGTFFGKIDATLSAFFRGQLIVAAIMASILGSGLFLIGTPMGILIGLAAGMANIVPYLSIVVGLAPALLLTYLQFGDWPSLAMVAALFASAQALEGFVISPKVIEKAVGLHPVAVIVALMAGGGFFGFVGILLAVPVAAVLKIALSELDAVYLKSKLYLGDDKGR